MFFNDKNYKLNNPKKSVLFFFYLNNITGEKYCVSNSILNSLRNKKIKFIKNIILI